MKAKIVLAGMFLSFVISLRTFIEQVPGLYWALLIVIVADVVLATIRAALNRDLSSDVAFKGLARKSAELIIVAVCHALDIYKALDIPFSLGTLMAVFFIYKELLSILENAHLLGVPMPEWFVELLRKLESGKFDGLG